jgi:tetratricopeptide (TPR) repeat protein
MLRTELYLVELTEKLSEEPGSISDTVTRLIDWSRRSSWGLARVEYVSEFARERVLSSLRYALAEEFIPLHEVELPSDRSASEIVQFLIQHLNTVDAGVVSVSGFATAFESDTSLEDSLRVLNFNRENLVPKTLRQIWWLPSSFAEIFVPAVPDLDSWFTTRLYLTESGPSPFSGQIRTDYRRSKILSNLPPRNPLFTGRETILNSINDALNSRGMVVIYGIGGIGKTQTAVEYAHRRCADYKTLLWTSADNEDSLARGFFRIAVLLDLPEVHGTDQTSAVEAARRWLELNDDWLLILDELKEPGVWSLPIGNGKRHILVTSRMRLHQSSPSIALAPMTVTESRELLFNRGVSEPINEKERRAIDDIAKELTYHPLSLDLAAAYIGKEKISFTKYLTLYRECSYRFHAKKTEPIPAFTTIELTFRELNKSAQELLNVCSFFNPSEIPVELLAWTLEILPKIDADSSATSDKTDEFLMLTNRYSLMHADVLARNCTIHPIVQASIRGRMDQNEQRKWAEKALRIVSYIFAYPEMDWTERERLLPTALTVAELVENWDFSSRDAAILLATVGLHLQRRAQRARAESLLRRALKLATDFNEPHEPVRDNILSSLANLYYNEGRYKEARKLITRLMRLQESQTGSDSPAFANTLTVLAQIELAERRYEEAESLLRRSIEILRSAPDQDLEKIITTIDYLGAAYLEQERYADAESIFNLAVQIGEHNLGERHPKIIRTLIGLARSYLGQKKHDLAKSIYRRLLRLTEEQDLHQEYAQSLTDLAYIHMVEESYAEAIPLLQRARDLHMRTRDNWNEARTLDYLASAYFQEDRYEDAERSLREALRVYDHLLGPSHPRVVRAWGTYARILRVLGREEEASQIEQKISRMEA